MLPTNPPTATLPDNQTVPPLPPSPRSTSPTKSSPAWRQQLDVDTDLKVDRQRYPRGEVMAEVREFSQVSNWKSAQIIATQWVVMVGAGWFAIASGHWLVYIVSALVIASRLQCLGVLMHDGAHYLLFTNRTVNDFVSEMFVAFPLGLCTTLYRHDHFIHHRYTNTEKDPDVHLQHQDSDFRWPKTRWGCFSVIIRSIFGINLHRMFQATKAWSPWYNLFSPISPKLPLAARIMLVTTTVSVYVAVYYSGLFWPLMFLAVVPGFTMLNLTNRIRVTAEHMRVPAVHELNSTRTVVPTWFERFFVAPYGVSYHIEHHLFPSVPGRNLAKLHQRLMQDERFRSRAHVTRSYLGVLTELMTPADQTVTPVS